MTTTRSQLRAELSSRLLPALRARGFTGPDVISGNSLLHQFKRPGIGGTQVLSIQLEKRGSPRFVLNLSVEPREGLGRLVSLGGVVRQGRLKPKRGATTRSWFRADPPIWRRLLGYSDSRAAKAVTECLALLPEVDTWWETQTESDHIAVLEHTLRGQQEIKP